MKLPGKTTLNRMQQTALEEQERIEISQDGRVRAKMLNKPMPGQVLKRDDFAGIVRMIDIVRTDLVLWQRLEERLASTSAIQRVAGPGAADVEIEGEAS